MIKLLGSDSFRGSLAAPKATGLNPIFRAKIQIGDESHRCYVKPMPDQLLCPVTNRVVANQEPAAEALGYVLAKTVGLQVPELAGVILLTTEQLPETLLPKLLASAPRQDSYTCWFSKDMLYPSCRYYYVDESLPDPLLERQIAYLANQLSKHPDAASIIAFDDWLLNSDRNPGNLLQGPGTLLLIDHGRIFIYPNWAPGGLGHFNLPYENRLQHLIDRYEQHWSSLLPNKSARFLAHNTFSVKFRQEGEKAARRTLAEFFEHADVDAIIQLLLDRLDSHQHPKEVGLLA